MQHNNYQRKFLRRSSPHQEIELGFANWVRGLRSIEQAREGLLRTRLVEQPGNQRIELIAPPSCPQRQSDDEGRWQDDGGESG